MDESTDIEDVVIKSLGGRRRSPGGSTDRPDLQRLLDDIRARKIDVIVVYKVDRLTRSLADFAKLVELFDAHGVSFVSVTQQFNTTTSMGRLTLNVLLSFAQFEREVTSERIRDKIAASKRKGLWVGGPLPLGYDMKDGKIAVVESEAEQVKLIYKRYLELSGVNALVRDLKVRNIRTKTRPLTTGGIRGGIPFERGALFYLLRNRFYIGDAAGIATMGAVRDMSDAELMTLEDIGRESVSYLRKTLGLPSTKGVRQPDKKPTLSSELPSPHGRSSRAP